MFGVPAASQRMSSLLPPSARALERTFAAAADLPPHEVLPMPSLSPTMEQGNIAKWNVKEGDKVGPGVILCSIETDKATLEWEAMDEGYVAKILVGDGAQNIPCGQTVAVIVEEESDIAAFASYTASADAAPAAPEPAPAAAPAAPAAAAPSRPAPPPGGLVFASPLAKRVAAEKGVDISALSGTGPGGRVVAADVLEAPAAGAGAGMDASAASFGGYSAYEDVPVDMIKKVTATRLLESKQTVPHYYLQIDCEIDAMMAARAQLNAVQEKTGGPKLSVNDFVVKAAALSCKQVPDVNASWMGDFIRRYHTVDISVAVQTEHGLMVPIVRDACTKGIGAISGDVKELAGKAKDGKLQPHEFMGGTFTISNLGMFGVKQFCAIVNPPQACILAVGGTQKRVVPGGDGSFKEVSVMTATISCDHRVVDGAVGATWLKAFKTYVEHPMTMLL